MDWVSHEQLEHGHSSHICPHAAANQDLLAICMCSAVASSEPSPVDNIHGLIIGELDGVA